MVQILLATYNGGLYISQQLDSLLAQTYQDWMLLVHDDGSADNTVEIIKSYQQKHPNKIILIEDGIRFGSAQFNFGHLLSLAQPGYIMCCDQDDVWLENKVELTLNKMLETETKNSDLPVVIHTDLKIVDNELNVITNSMFSYQKLFRYQSAKEMLIRNNVTGCTMMLNKRACDISLPIPKEAMMHDWWIALKTLSSGGVVEFVDQPTILYRQHCSNSVGAVKVNLWHFIKRSRLFNRCRNNVFDEVIAQAKLIDPKINAWKLRFRQYMLIIRILRMS